jgi:16S rRNA U1498 N3-methylase RsmE
MNTNLKLFLLCKKRKQNQIRSHFFCVRHEACQDIINIITELGVTRAYCCMMKICQIVKITDEKNKKADLDRIKSLR